MLLTENTLTTGVEAIQFRPDTVLFDELTDVFNGFSAGEIKAEQLKDIFPKIVEKHTGIKIKFTVNPSTSFNGWAMPPVISLNNPVFTKYTNEFREAVSKEVGNDFDVIVRKTNIGWVDLAKGRVYGAYCDLACEVGLTAGTFLSKRYTSQEKAALLLHEIGHIFTSFEMLGSVVSTNLALAAISDRLSKVKDVNRKVELLKSAKESLRIKNVDDDKILNSKSGVAIACVLRDAKIKAIRSEHGLTPYDESYFEALSDQFATRHGAGRHLVTGLNKAEMADSNLSYLKKGGRIVLYMVQITISIVATIATIGIFLIGMILLGFWFSSIFGDEYDDVPHRFQRIRNDMVNQLKDKDLDPAVRERIIHDLKNIDSIIAEIKPFFGIWDLIYKTFYGRHRREFNELELQQDLERLATNNLFVKAAEFKSAV